VQRKILKSAASDLWLTSFYARVVLQDWKWVGVYSCASGIILFTLYVPRMLCILWLLIQQNATFPAASTSLASSSSQMGAGGECSCTSWLPSSPSSSQIQCNNSNIPLCSLQYVTNIFIFLTNIVIECELHLPLNIYKVANICMCTEELVFVQIWPWICNLEILWKEHGNTYLCLE
jgi:hypothetical protein